MGGVWDSFEEGSKKIGEFFGGEGITGESRNTKRKKRAAWEAAQPRKAPSIDDASRSQIETDRLRRRQGVLANIYGGNSPATPTVGTKQLLGS